MATENPFTLARASDFTDKQINSLWTELGTPEIINTIIEPKSRVSKFILGGKGTGKTHLLRYYSYPVIRLRSPNESGISILKRQKFLAVFLRATGVDATRFEASSGISINWQQLFGVYLELRLAEGILEALCDIKLTSTASEFNDDLFLNEIKSTLFGTGLDECRTIHEFRNWVILQRRNIDEAVNNAAFSGNLELRAPFSIGSLCLPISKAMHKWHPQLAEIPLLYLIDEIENFSLHQQQVVNSLIRYGESLATFRVTGRRYAIKTLKTLADGEENREGAEFKTTFLDDILLSEDIKFQDFAKRFVIKRLQSANIALKPNSSTTTGQVFNPALCFEDIPNSNFYAEVIEKLKSPSPERSFVHSFVSALYNATSDKPGAQQSAEQIAELLIQDFPLIIQKLNVLLFMKKCKKGAQPLALAESIQADARSYINPETRSKNYYSNAYGHYASDLFAQICKEAPSGRGVLYAGFENFVKMASGNPRNLLIILGKAYDIATFRGVDFVSGQKLSLELQTEAASDAARFMYESDTNFGQDSDIALAAISRLASILRTARFSINIPEVSPLAFSFSDDDLTARAKKVLQNALNYSLVFEMTDGRPDRNSQKLNRKIQLNPLLSPKWSLPISRRGDISLNKELLSAVFDAQGSEDFDILLKRLEQKWNTISKAAVDDTPQGALF